MLGIMWNFFFTICPLPFIKMPQTNKTKKTNKNQPPKSTKANERKEKRIKKRKVCGNGRIKENHR
jgi:hypothetical protein